MNIFLYIVMLMVILLHWYLFFYQKLPYFPLCQHYFAGERRTIREKGEEAPCQ